MTMTVRDEASLDWLDFAITCDDDDGCDAAADWWFTCLRCARHVPLCGAHKRELHGLLELWAPSGTDACIGCGDRVPANQWRDLFAFVPIGRS